MIPYKAVELVVYLNFKIMEDIAEQKAKKSVNRLALVYIF
jgi:hypothetical protein